jgi:hypothetical protein
MRHFLFAVFALLLSVGGVLLPADAWAQDAVAPNACVPPSYRNDVRPDPDGEPTEVTIGMLIADLVAISDVDQSISVDVVLRMRWTDPRLAAYEGCKLPISAIWFPELILKNSGRMFSRWPETVSIEEGGRVTYQQRVSGSFSTYHKLEGYPFDPVEISLRFYPLDWSIEKLVFKDDPGFTGSAPLLNISDWRLLSVEAAVQTQDINGFHQTRASYELKITAARYTSYYFWKIMLPISMIVVMSWFAFWIDPKEFGTQIGLSATSVLTMVAFIFATTNLLPRLGYFTMLDKYVAASTVFVFIALFQSLATGYMTSQGRHALALRLDRISRVVFPLGFIVTCVMFYTALV